MRIVHNLLVAYDICKEMDMFVGVVESCSHAEAGDDRLQGYHAFPLRRLRELFARHQSGQCGEHGEAADSMSGVVGRSES